MLMRKYYVGCGSRRRLLLANNCLNAAKRVLEYWIEHSKNLSSCRLGETVIVSQRGFFINLVCQDGMEEAFDFCGISYDKRKNSLKKISKWKKNLEKYSVGNDIIFTTEYILHKMHIPEACIEKMCGNKDIDDETLDEFN